MRKLWVVIVVSLGMLSGTDTWAQAPEERVDQDAIIDQKGRGSLSLPIAPKGSEDLQPHSNVACLP